MATGGRSAKTGWTGATIREWGIDADAGALRISHYTITSTDPWYVGFHGANLGWRLVHDSRKAEPVRVRPLLWFAQDELSSEPSANAPFALRGRSQRLPLWLPVLVFGVLPARRVLRRRRDRNRRRAGHCPACGYDLRATPGRCPECDTVPAPVASVTGPSGLVARRPVGAEAESGKG
jgi:hypothetical protein